MQAQSGAACKHASRQGLRVVHEQAEQGNMQARIRAACKHKSGQHASTNQGGKQAQTGQHASMVQGRDLGLCMSRPGRAK